MIARDIFWMSSGISRSPFLSGTSAPSTRNIAGSPDFRWMSEAPPLSAIFRISLSSKRRPLGAPRTRSRGFSRFFVRFRPRLEPRARARGSPPPLAVAGTSKPAARRESPHRPVRLRFPCATVEMPGRRDCCAGLRARGETCTGMEVRAQAARGARRLASAALAAGLLGLTSCVVLPVRIGPAVEGQVVDQASGRPLAGAVVVVRFDGRYDDVLPDRDLIGHQEALTDASGRFADGPHRPPRLLRLAAVQDRGACRRRDARGLPLRGAARGARHGPACGSRSRPALDALDRRESCRPVTAERGEVTAYMDAWRTLFADRRRTAARRERATGRASARGAHGARIRRELLRSGDRSRRRTRRCARGVPRRRQGRTP